MKRCRHEAGSTEDPEWSLDSQWAQQVKGEETNIIGKDGGIPQEWMELEIADKRMFLLMGCLSFYYWGA